MDCHVTTHTSYARNDVRIAVSQLRFAIKRYNKHIQGKN